MAIQYREKRYETAQEKVSFAVNYVADSYSKSLSVKDNVPSDFSKKIYIEDLPNKIFNIKERINKLDDFLEVSKGLLKETDKSVEELAELYTDELQNTEESLGVYNYILSEQDIDDTNVFQDIGIWIKEMTCTSIVAGSNIKQGVESAFLTGVEKIVETGAIIATDVLHGTINLITTGNIGKEELIERNQRIKDNIDLDHTEEKYDGYFENTEIGQYIAANSALSIEASVGESLKQTGATIVVGTECLLKGVLKVVEGVVDLAVIVSSIMATPGTLLVDAGNLIFGKEATATKEYWERTKSVVSYTAIDNASDWFYTTPLGQWADANSAFTHDSTAANIIEGIGYTAGIVALTVLTGGALGVTSGAASMASFSPAVAAAVAGSVGMGRGTEEAWNNEAGIVDGLAYGVATGAWEAAQWYVGAKIGTSTILKGTGLGTKFANAGLRMVADAFTGAVETPARTLINSIYNGQTLGENWDALGGWSGVAQQTAIAFGSSLIGEGIEGIQVTKNTMQVNNIKKQVEIDVNGKIQLDVEKLKGLEVDDANSLLKEYIIKEDFDNAGVMLAEYDFSSISNTKEFTQMLSGTSENLKTSVEKVNTIELTSEEKIAMYIEDNSKKMQDSTFYREIMEEITEEYNPETFLKMAELISTAKDSDYVYGIHLSGLPESQLSDTILKDGIASTGHSSSGVAGQYSLSTNVVLGNNEITFLNNLRSTYKNNQSAIILKFPKALIDNESAYRNLLFDTIDGKTYIRPDYIEGYITKNNGLVDSFVDMTSFERKVNIARIENLKPNEAKVIMNEYLVRGEIKNADIINSKYDFSALNGDSEYLRNVELLNNQKIKILDDALINKNTVDGIKALSDYDYSFIKNTKEFNDKLDVLYNRMIKEIKDNPYEGARLFAKTDAYDTLLSYCNHGEAHVKLVTLASLDAAAAFEKIIKDGDLYFTNNINELELYVAGLYHDTGMAGGLQVVKPKGEAVIVDLPDGTKTIKYRNLTTGALESAEYKLITGDTGKLTRKNHSLNSALTVLENADTIKAYGADPEIVALLAFSHSKSTSGVTNMINANDWEVSIRTIGDAVNKYNELNPEKMISFDVESLLKKYNDNPQRIQTEAACLRLGDAAADKDGLTQAGNDIKVAEGKAGKSEITEADIQDYFERHIPELEERIKNLPEDEIQDLKRKFEVAEDQEIPLNYKTMEEVMGYPSMKVATEMEDAIILIKEKKTITNSAGVEETEIIEVDPKTVDTFGRMYTVGENNLKFNTKANENGAIVFESIVQDANVPQYTTLTCIEERLKELITLKGEDAIDTKFTFDVKLPAGTSSEIVEIYANGLDNMSKLLKDGIIIELNVDGSIVKTINKATN